MISRFLSGFLFSIPAFFVFMASSAAAPAALIVGAVLIILGLPWNLLALAVLSAVLALLDFLEIIHIRFEQEFLIIVASCLIGVHLNGITMYARKSKKAEKDGELAVFETQDKSGS